MARRMLRPRVDPRIGLLLEMLGQAFDQRGWHGTTLRGALRGVTPSMALWRPGPAGTTSGSWPFTRPIGSMPFGAA